METILSKLQSVLCDPEGKCCISGSDADRTIVDEALAELTTLPPASAAGDSGAGEREPTREMISAAALFPIENRLFSDPDGKTQVLGFAQARALLRAALATKPREAVAKKGGV